ncbi:MAG: glycoside hydrolase family 28 protein [Micromonosporaceae bacterium]|nr:glycoside hydrolase family 28 protein [Micromonosporaceae bacterium]
MTNPDPWHRADEIRATVTPPTFPDATVDLTAFGAIGDGRTDATDALQRAIETCSAAGGGRVLVPAGRFTTGPIRLLTGVDLHLESGATLAFSTDPTDYLPPVPTRFEGLELMGYSPLISAYGQENIAITGQGVLDGQAATTNWWPWKGLEEYGWRPGQPCQAAARARLMELAEAGVPVEQRVLADGSYLRPSFIQPYQCRGVMIEDVTIRRSPMWVIHPVLCSQVLVRRVTVDSHGPNSDGCDPESCTDVVIADCVFDTGDDCIALKSGRNADGRRIAAPTERVLIERCEFRDGHGGVTLGSEISGGVREVFAQQLRMTSPALDVALRFKTNSMRGGFIDGVHARSITVDSVARTAIEIDLDYEEGPGHGFNPDLREIHISDLTVAHARQAVMLRGYPDAPIRDISLSDLRFERSDVPEVIEHVERLAIRNVRNNGAHLRRPATEDRSAPRS